MVRRNLTGAKRFPELFLFRLEGNDPTPIPDRRRPVSVRARSPADRPGADSRSGPDPSHGDVGRRTGRFRLEGAELTEQTARETFVGVFSELIVLMPGDPWAKTQDMKNASGSRDREGSERTRLTHRAGVGRLMPAGSRPAADGAPSGRAAKTSGPDDERTPDPGRPSGGPPIADITSAKKNLT